MILLLHNIRSLHNVGSIFRTADGAGVEKIYLCGYTPAPVDRWGKYRPQISKVALGAEKTISWEKKNGVAAVVRKLRAEGYKIFAVEQDPRSVPYYSLLPTRYSLPRVALMFGNEVRGLPPSVLKLADKILEIPMLGRKESLNVSVSVGVVVYGLLEKGM
ncbi:MAG: TrmH family RNA methyltransferase [Candidatus Liptonbacteria bacterium]|nr:TrmH family RNA methyltransferase [Candidatus Liptonbacteria bacterium]